MSLSSNGLKESNLVLAVPYLLLITVTLLFLHYSLDGVLGQSRFEAVEKAPTKGPEGARQKALNRQGLALNKITVNLGFLSAFSLLGFDFKQNLRTWPVLSNGLERSPPSL